MNLYDVISKLRSERAKLDEVIASLERLRDAEELQPPKKRRGRKSMDEQGRKEVSERMKRYWTAWRLKRQQGLMQ